MVGHIMVTVTKVQDVQIPPFSQIPGQCLRFDVRHTNFVVIAEIVEILAFYQGGTWNCCQSQGEALSRVLATELYPGELNQAYGTGAVWLNDSDRGVNTDNINFIESNWPSDINPIATGCGVLFLNYLHYHNGYSWTDIINAGGNCLGDVYRNLTRNPNANAWEPFLAEMNNRFPPGQLVPVIMDNPYLI